MTPFEEVVSSGSAIGQDRRIANYEVSEAWLRKMYSL